MSDDILVRMALQERLHDAEQDDLAPPPPEDTDLDMVGPSDPEPYIKRLLNGLAELKAQEDALRLEQQALVDSVLTPAIRQQIADIECEFAPRVAEAKTRAAQVESEVKAATVFLQRSVKGDHLQAVYSKGRVSWDTRALDGYAAAHPEVAQFKREGEPSVGIRKV